ncbi:hypothetical protein [Acinetobacter ursingii]|uniref:hypothetical protein n=1 Tax=Acinetobacter ursingii TaxID=108980 RepID=UPI00300B35C6
MVDLEKEHNEFCEKYRVRENGIIFSAELNTFDFGNLKQSANKSEINLLIEVRKMWSAWLRCAESKQVEIDSLKAENEELKTAYSGTNAALLEQLKINSDLHEKLLGVSDGEYVVIKKDDIENWYLDEGEYVWYEKDSIDGYLEDLDNGEVLEVQRKEYVVINSNPVFATNVYEDADNINWELFDSKEEAEKAATHCKAMVEAQGDGDE